MLAEIGRELTTSGATGGLIAGLVLIINRLIPGRNGFDPDRCAGHGERMARLETEIAVRLRTIDGRLKSIEERGAP